MHICFLFIVNIKKIQWCPFLRRTVFTQMDCFLPLFSLAFFLAYYFSFYGFMSFYFVFKYVCVSAFSFMTAFAIAIYFFHLSLGFVCDECPFIYKYIRAFASLLLFFFFRSRMNISSYAVGSLSSGKVWSQLDLFLLCSCKIFSVVILEGLSLRFLCLGGELGYS